MAIDRQRIERRDFPLAQEGYSREAVDAHLAAIAEELAARRSGAGSGSAVSLAEAAAARVRAIVGEAEARGAQIARDAERAATRTREETDRELARVRNDAVRRTRTEVREVHSTLETIVRGLDEAERDVRSAIALLRDQAGRLGEELALVDREMDRAYEALRANGAGGEDEAPAAPAEEEPAPAAAQGAPGDVPAPAAPEAQPQAGGADAGAPAERT
jgi:hypothetical protein